MKKSILVFALLLLAGSSFSQLKKIAGSWICRESDGSVQFFIKPDGKTEKRTAGPGEDVWQQTPKTGTSTFKNDRTLTVKWSGKTVEVVQVKFIDGNAEFRMKDPKTGLLRTYLFLKIVDEEVIIEK